MSELAPNLIHSNPCFAYNLFLFCRLHLYAAAKAISPNVAYFVPRNTDPKQLAMLAGEGNVCEIEQNYLQGYLKALTAYYSELVDPNLELNPVEEAVDGEVDGAANEDTVEETVELEAVQEDTVADNSFHISAVAAGSKRSVEAEEDEHRKLLKINSM